jgi:hypothetical protein
MTYGTTKFEREINSQCARVFNGLDELSLCTTPQMIDYIKNHKSAIPHLPFNALPS